MTRDITSETMTIDQIEVSPLNVRRHRAAIEQTSAMEASILSRGLIQPLNVHPMKGSKKFGAFAGGRRSRAIRNLIKSERLPADWPIRVELYRGYSDIDIIELSLNENIQRADLELYEICAGIRALDTRGESLEAIAKALGQDLPLVRKWHRVGQLAEPIFEAFSQGALGGDEARAYAATADQKLQMAVYDELRALPEWQRTPDKIRAALKVGDRQSSKLLRLVGVDGYRAAGGSFELDLFAGDAVERGRVVDEGLLRELAEKQLATLRDETRAAVGIPDLRFVAKPPEGSHGSPDYTLEVTPKMVDGKPVIPDAGVVAAIDLSEAGVPRVTYWWEDRKTKFGLKGDAKPRVEIRGAQAARDPFNYAAPAKAQAKEEHGVTSDALEVMMSIRRELLRALLVEDAQRGCDSGRDYATWSALRVAIGPDSAAEVGARGIAMGGTIGAFELAAKSKEHVDQHKAHRVWTEAVRQMSAEPFITDSNRATAFMAFASADDATKRLAAAVVAGLALERSGNAPGFQMAPHDAIARATGADDDYVRMLWSPTAEFLELLPKAQLLAIAEPIVGPETFDAWSKVKGSELPALLAEALAGKGHAVAARNPPSAAQWVHPILKFEPVGTMPALLSMLPAPKTGEN
jgi:ParB family chromosome partitioning protein